MIEGRGIVVGLVGLGPTLAIPLDAYECAHQSISLVVKLRENCCHWAPTAWLMLIASYSIQKPLLEEDFEEAKLLLHILQVVELPVCSIVVQMCSYRPQSQHMNIISIRT